MRTSFVTIDSGRAIEDWLWQSRHLCIVILGRNFIIQEYNPGFAALFAPGCELHGQSLLSLLLPASRPLLASLLVDHSVARHLNLDVGSAGCVSLDCRCCSFEQGYLLVGERCESADSAVLQKMTVLHNELVALTRELHRKNKQLLQAQAQIKVLSGILPICMYCKEIRDDQGYWNKLEKFISEHSQAEFSHGICERCMAEKFGAELAAIDAEKCAKEGDQQSTPPE